MGHHFRATVAYDGTDFSGFQIQGRTANADPVGVYPPDAVDPPDVDPPDKRRSPRTVQGVLEDALAEVSRERSRLLAAGRTDAGVHALGQVVSFNINWRHSLADLHRAWNALLPDDVAILSLCQAPQGFHPRFDATSRAYRYTIWNHPVRNPLFRRTALWVPQSLDVVSMGEALERLVGEHDFATFGTVPGRRGAPAGGSPSAGCNPSGRGTTRRVLGATCCWSKSPVADSGRPGRHRADKPDWILYLDVEADAFLYRMVRSIVGTILQVGRGQISVAQFVSLFGAADRSQAGPTAPPHGLCLMAVNYVDSVALG